MLGVVALCSAWAVMPASAGRLSFSSTPASGPPGTQISVNGVDCSDAPNVTVELLAPDESSVASSTIEADGSWEGTIDVPDDAAPGMYTLTAFCNGSDEDGFPYNNNTFQVTGTAPTTTTTPTTVVAQATTTTTTVAPVVVQAPPAAPVVAEPATAG